VLSALNFAFVLEVDVVRLEWKGLVSELGDSLPRGSPRSIVVLIFQNELHVDILRVSSRVRILSIRRRESRNNVCFTGRGDGQSAGDNNVAVVWILNNSRQQNSFYGSIGHTIDSLNFADVVKVERPRRLSGWLKQISNQHGKVLFEHGLASNRFEQYPEQVTNVRLHLEAPGAGRLATLMRKIATSAAQEGL
jgi:hypothetical protein